MVTSMTMRAEVAEINAQRQLLLSKDMSQASHIHMPLLGSNHIVKLRSIDAGTAK